MALRGIQDYIARDVNNIFLYPPKKSHPFMSHIIARTIIILLPSLSQSAWNTRCYIGHQMPYMKNNLVYSRSQQRSGLINKCILHVQRYVRKQKLMNDVLHNFSVHDLIY